MSNFKIKGKYRLEDITQCFGGSPQPSMPIVGRKVPYCKFDPDLNPKFPVVWIEKGPLREDGADLMSRSAEKTPVFKKCGEGEWEYCGEADVTDITSSDLLAEANGGSNPPRDPVVKILELQF